MTEAGLFGTCAGRIGSESRKAAVANRKNVSDESVALIADKNERALLWWFESGC